MFKCSDVLRGESKGPVLVEWARVIIKYGAYGHRNLILFRCTLNELSSKTLCKKTTGTFYKKANFFK